MSHYVVHHLHTFHNCFTIKYIRNNVRQIFFRNNFLTVAEFDNSLCNFLDFFLRKRNTYFVEIFLNIGFPRSFSEGVFSSSAEAFGHQIIKIQIIFVIAVSVNSCCLGKNVFTNNRFINWNTKARKRFYDFTNRI